MLLQRTNLEEIISKEEYLVSFVGTLKQFQALNEVKADYIQDYIYVQMAASVTHEEIFSNLFFELNRYVRTHQLGKVLGSRFAVAIGPDYQPEPDIVFISKENPGIFSEMVFTGVPDLIVEIISRSTRKLDMETKRGLYQQYKVPELYFVDFTNKQVYIDVMKDSRYETFTLQNGLFESRILPGFVWQVEKMYTI